MRLASYNAHGRTSFGVVEGDGVVDLRLRGLRHTSVLDIIKAGALGEAATLTKGARPDFKLSDVELLPPVLSPEKILCIGINYNRDAEYKQGEQQHAAGRCSMFFRTPGSLVGHNQPILLPPESEQLDYEGEIAIVIGKEGRRISRESALSHIMGMTLCNEGCLRDWMRHGKFNVTQGKNWDLTGSIGPWLVTADEVDLTKPLEITVRINGEITQFDTTASMIKSFSDLIAYVSTFMTLKAGDIIVTGTPIKIGPRTDPPTWLKAGDTIEISVPEIGTLRNTVVNEK